MGIYAETLKLNEHWASYITNSKNFKYNWAQGAFRSSKSVSNTLAFALYLETTHDKIHLVIASTVASARAIVEDGDGALGLRYYFAGKYKMTKYKGNDAGRIKTATGEKIVVYLGGLMESSYKVFRGWSVGAIILEEANLLHKNTINEIKGRILLAKDPKVFIAHNPVSSHHPIYDWLEELQSKGLVNYDHSTIDDNPALTEERKNEIKAEFDPDSIFYKQYILGQRVDAEGLVYKLYDYSTFNQFDKNEYIRYVISCDPGETVSATSMVLGALRRGFLGIDIIKEYYHRNADKKNKNNQKTNTEYAKDLAQFVLESIQLMGYLPDCVILDNGGAFYKDVKNEFNKEPRLRGITIKYPEKIDIEERIKRSSSLIYKGRIRFRENCTETIESFKSVQYDEKQLLLGKSVYSDHPELGTRCDPVDASCYMIPRYESYLNSIQYDVHDYM